MRTVEIDEVGDFRGLLREALDGEPIILAQNGRPRLQVTAIEEGALKAIRRTGFMKGEISIPEDFDTMFQDEIIAMFEGSME